MPFETFRILRHFEFCFSISVIYLDEIHFIISLRITQFYYCWGSILMLIEILRIRNLTVAHKKCRVTNRDLGADVLCVYIKVKNTFLFINTIFIKLQTL